MAISEILIESLDFRENFNPDYIMEELVKKRNDYFAVGEDEYFARREEGETITERYKEEIGEMIEDFKYCLEFKYNMRDYSHLLKDAFVRNLGISKKEHFVAPYNHFDENGIQLTEPWLRIIFNAWKLQGLYDALNITIQKENKYE